MPDRRFEDTIAVSVNAPPEAIFEAGIQVTVNDMPIARALGLLNYPPGGSWAVSRWSDAPVPFSQLPLSSG